MSTELRVPETTVLALGGTPAVLEEAMDLVQDDATPMPDRVALWASLYNLQKTINRALGIRQKGQTAQDAIKHAMAAAGAKQWGPIRLTWRAVGVRYTANDPDNWTDDSVQGTLREWAASGRYTAPDGTPWVPHIPGHYEINSAALGAAVAAGDPVARELYEQIKARHYRTEEHRDAVLTVEEPKR